MIKIGSVFSGIGAMEHALEKMGISYEIIFACDNGGVDIFKENIELDLKIFKDKIKFLKKEINKFLSNNLEYFELLVNELYIVEKKVYSISKEIEKTKSTIEKKEFIETRNLIITLISKVKKYKVFVNLNKLKTFKEKKKYIDKLYEKREKNNYVKKSYFANYDIEKDRFHWDISFLEGRQYRNKIDLFVGGSPCQSFSKVGKQRGLEDARGTLFYDYARLVKEIQPKVFIYENVKAILENDEGKTWRKITKIFDELNYDWTMMVLNAKNFGIPQNRERVFVVGFKKKLKVGTKFKSPKPMELKKHMKDLLFNDVEAKYYLSEKTKKYVLSTGTKKFYSKPKVDLDIARTLLTTMHKMHRAGIDNYVTTNGRLRRLTPRECLRLMGFSDEFKIVVSDTQLYKQTGNSIVVDVLIYIMYEIIKVTDEKIKYFN